MGHLNIVFVENKLAERCLRLPDVLKNTVCVRIKFVATVGGIKILDLLENVLRIYVQGVKKIYP